MGDTADVAFLQRHSEVRRILSMQHGLNTVHKKAEGSNSVLLEIA